MIYIVHRKSTELLNMIHHARLIFHKQINARKVLSLRALLLKCYFQIFFSVLTIILTDSALVMGSLGLKMGVQFIICQEAIPNSLAFVIYHIIQVHSDGMSVNSVVLVTGTIILAALNSIARASALVTESLGLNFSSLFITCQLMIQSAFPFTKYFIIQSSGMSGRVVVMDQVLTTIPREFIARAKNSALVIGLSGLNVPSAYPRIIHLFANS
jgi:hypothetical protein